MQPSTAMSRLGWVGTAFQWIWTFRRLITIVALSISLIYLIASGALEHSRDMVAEFRLAQARVAAAEAGVKTSGDAVFSGPARDGRSITEDQAAELALRTRELRSVLTSFSAPTSSIRETRAAYLNSLTTLQGALNLFEPGEQGTIAILTALDGIDGPATDFHEAAEAYTEDFVSSLFAAF